MLPSTRSHSIAAQAELPRAMSRNDDDQRWNKLFVRLVHMSVRKELSLNSEHAPSAAWLEQFVCIARQLTGHTRVRRGSSHSGRAVCSSDKSYSRFAVQEMTLSQVRTSPVHRWAIRRPSRPYTWSQIGDALPRTWCQYCRVQRSTRRSLSVLRSVLTSDQRPN